MERRLAAIIAADVVNYSGLMAQDEAGTLAALKSCLDEILEPAIAAHKGRVVKLTGDGLLAEFASAVEAVSCAAEVQKRIGERNAGIPQERRFRYRIGINLGDIIVEDGDIFGDGVNVAARLEAIAEPGGISLAASVYDQVRAKVDLAFEDLGEQALKNIPEPVRVYRVRLEGAAAAAPASAATTPPGAGKPVIAVLPFDNMSSDPEQEFFADGMTEDVITELSRFQNIEVIARNSVFTYKGRAVKVQEVAAELGVGYVLEGSVRRAGDRIRLSVQLIDGASGKHIWAERYDRELSDIFDLQDELTQTIVAALPSRIESASVERIKHKAPTDIGVYDRLIKAKLLHHRASAEANAEGLRLLDQAIELDPDFAPAHGWRACTLGQAAARGWRVYNDALMDEVYAEVQTGLALDDNDIECTRILAEIHLLQGQLDEALTVNDKALRLTPNDPRILAQRGEILTWLGRAEEGLEWLEKAIALDPFEADTRIHLLGRAFFGARRYGEALAAFKRVPAPGLQHKAYMAACQAYLGGGERVKAAKAAVLAADADFSAGTFLTGLFYTDEEDRAHLREGLIKAALPA